MRVMCDSTVIDTTLAHLREAGRVRRECVVLWLGRREGDAIRVIDAYRPLQNAEADMFYIPPVGMARVHAELRRHRAMVAAQVHSHPCEAFHSLADDRWAIVRHKDALSLVVPYFASDTTRSNFLAQTKVFRLSAQGQWLEVAPLEVARSCLTVL